MLSFDDVVDISLNPIFGPTHPDPNLQCKLLGERLCKNREMPVDIRKDSKAKFEVRSHHIGGSESGRHAREYIASDLNARSEISIGIVK